MKRIQGVVEKDRGTCRSLVAAALFLVQICSPQAAITLDPQFDTGPGTELYAEHVIPLPSGKILVCGAFRWYDLEERPYIIRLNEDGTPDPTFKTFVVYGWVRHMEVQPDGKILVGGAFPAVSGISRNLIARLNEDGSLDPTFDPGTGFEEKLVPADPNPPYVFWLTLQRDGKIVVVGSFAKYNGQTARGIARLNPDGSLDTTFQMGAGLDSWGRFVTVLPEGQILVTGWFTDYNGFGCNRMVRLNPNGTPDPGFRPYFGDKTAIYSAALLPDGKMIVSGHSKSDFGLFKREITRLNPDGTEDPSFLAHTDNRTESILVAPDGKFYACGWFDHANDQPRGKLARFDPDGSLDDSFRADADFFVWNMALDAKGRLLIVGGFPEVLGVKRLGIARLADDSSVGLPPASGGDGQRPVIEGTQLFHGVFKVSVETVTNKRYSLEKREDFTVGSWATIDSIEGNGGVATLTDFSPKGSCSCYRVRME